MAIKRVSKISSGISSASMTDLMFLLLLFLLISTTLISSNNALKLVLPKSANQLKENPYATVSIDAGLHFYLDDKPIRFDQLEEGLRTRLAELEEPTISLHCDKTVPIDEVVKVMNIAKDNGFRLILATQP